MHSTDPQPSFAATPHETRLHYLARATRRAVPLRWGFVQKPRGSETRSSVLATFARNGDHRGLLSYLFILALTSAENSDGWTTRLDPHVWARCFGTTSGTSTWAAALGSAAKVFDRLERRALIEVKRPGRKEVAATLLKEDGSGEPYTRPGAGNKDGYLQLHHDFWTEELDARLKLPGLVMLLVLMTLPAWSSVPSERFPEWYGWSPDTAERGYRELRNLGLVEVRERHIKAPNAPMGYTLANTYKLADPFRHAPGTRRLQAGSSGEGVINDQEEEMVVEAT
ncbi:hypothetical protein [Nonomuraea maritima]|uniref:hypothetical protein n=1 Tax=Nonomuraea maritima TaxID=683260 RepID=UPI0037106992